MLVLMREPKQMVRIGDDIEVCVVKVRGDQVWLGFNAPADVPVHRQEIYEKIQREKENQNGE